MPYSETPEVSNTGFTYSIFLNSGSIINVDYAGAYSGQPQEDLEAEFQVLVDKLADYPGAYMQRGARTVNSSYECTPTPPE